MTNKKKENFKLNLYLLSQLSGRSQYQSLCVGIIQVKFFQDGYGKCSCLPSSRLSLGNDISTWESTNNASQMIYNPIY